MQCQQYILGVAAILLMFALFTYFFGSVYRVYTQKEEKLIGKITSALADIENTKIEQEHQEEITLLRLEGSKKRLEVKEVSPLFFGKKYYTVTFKRWAGFESRNQVINYLEDSIH